MAQMQVACIPYILGMLHFVTVPFGNLFIQQHEVCRKRILTARYFILSVIFFRYALDDFNTHSMKLGITLICEKFRVCFLDVTFAGICDLKNQVGLYLVDGQ